MKTQSEPMELELAAAAVLGGDRAKPRRHGMDGISTKTAPAAFDEVFAALDRGLEAAMGSAPQTRSRAAIDPQPFRAASTQLDRQRERLAQLLREIEAGSSTT